MFGKQKLKQKIKELEIINSKLRNDIIVTNVKYDDVAKQLLDTYKIIRKENHDILKRDNIIFNFKVMLNMFLTGDISKEKLKSDYLKLKEKIENEKI